MKPATLVLTALLVLGTSGIGAPMAVAQVQKQRGVGPQGWNEVAIPQRTDAGDWNGTWMYVNRDLRMAIWIRTQNGIPEVKVQYFSLAAKETFTTDWQTRATYDVDGTTATFTIEPTQRDENTIKGAWRWELNFPDSGRLETGKVTLYRTGDGRQMVMLFEDLERVIRRSDGEMRFPLRQVWTFYKASKRLVLWDELPF